MHSRSVFALLLATLMPVTMAAQRGGPTGPQQASTPEPLKFRYMGPAPAGRIASVAGVPAIRTPTTWARRPAVSGNPPTPGRPSCRSSTTSDVAAIGAIAVADSDPNIVWVGTGEPWVIRYSDVMGDGVYKSSRRRQDLEAHGPRRDRPHLARPHPSRRIRTSSTSARRAG